MVKKVSNESEVTYAASLKHRLVGAAILILFAVILLPWMLGSYSIVDPLTENIEKKETNVAEGDVSSVEDVIVAESDEIQVLQPEQEVKVFVSRVQSLDKDVKPINIEVKKELTQIVQKADSAPFESVEKKENAKSDKAVVKKIVSEESKPKVIKAPAPVKKSIENGYIVSVGVFGNTANVEKMMSDLRTKNFNPSVRQEKFNSKTVNRIFMGPFATRAKAGKVKLKLYEKENIPSLIKEFP